MVDWHRRAEEIQAYVDGELEGSALQECEAHLQRCSSCARLAAKLLELSQALSAIAPCRPPEGLRERVLEAVAQAQTLPPLTCAEAAELASAYLDDELTDQQRDLLEAHLFTCPECYARHRRTLSVVESLRMLPRAAAPAELQERILAAVERAAHGGARFTWRHASRVAVALAAAAVLALALQLPYRPQPRVGDATTPQVAALPAPTPEALGAAPVPALSAGQPPAGTTAGSARTFPAQRERALPARSGDQPSRARGVSADTPSPTQGIAGTPAPSRASEMTRLGPAEPASLQPVRVAVEEPLMAAAQPAAQLRPAPQATIAMASAPGAASAVAPQPAITTPAPRPAAPAPSPEPPTEAVAAVSEPAHTSPVVGAVPYRVSYVRVHDGGSQRDPDTDRRMAAAITEQVRATAWSAAEPLLELR